MKVINMMLRRNQQEKPIYKPPEKILKNFTILLRSVGISYIYTHIFYLSIISILLTLYCFSLYFTTFKVYSMIVISIILDTFTFFKIIFLCQKRYKILELIQRFQNDWKEYVLDHPKPESKVVEANKLTELILLFYATNMGFWIFATLFYSIYTSVYYGEKQLNIVQITFGTDFGVDHQGLAHWIITIIILIAIIMVAFILYLSDCIFISFCLIIIAQLKSLREKFENVGMPPEDENLKKPSKPTKNKEVDDRISNSDTKNNDKGPNSSIIAVEDESPFTEEEVTEQLNLCVKRHNEILTHINVLDDIFSNQAFGQYFFTTITLCLLMFHFNYSFNTDVRIVPFTIFSLLTAFNLFIFTLFGQKIINESTNIVNSAYSVPWYRHSPKFAKSVLLVMVRSKKPAHISGSRFYIISMESFAKVISAAASYYTFLKNVSAQN